MTATYRGLSYEDVAGVIDHSLLRPELTLAEVAAGCEVAARYRVASVCCRPADVALAVQLLCGAGGAGAAGVAVGTVVAFPHGCTTTATKVFETREAIAAGASEIDMVLNIGWLRSGALARVEADIRGVVEAAHDARPGTIVKVILETAYLGDDQKAAACRAAESAGADYVKTSTGFAPSGATLPDLALLRANTSARVKVKAAGGVRSVDALIDAVEAGASRVGATATAAILEEFRSRAR